MMLRSMSQYLLEVIKACGQTCLLLKKRPTLQSAFFLNSFRGQFCGQVVISLWLMITCTSPLQVWALSGLYSLMWWSFQLANGMSVVLPRCLLLLKICWWGGGGTMKTDSRRTTLVVEWDFKSRSTLKALTWSLEGQLSHLSCLWNPWLIRNEIKQSVLILTALTKNEN